MSIFVAVDIDDTLCESALTIMQRVHEEFGHPKMLTVDELRETYNQPGQVGGWEEERIQKRIAALFNDPEFLIGLPLVEQSLEGTQTLEERLGIGAYTTSRPEALRKPTQRWLEDNHFPQAPLWMRDIRQQAKNWKLLELTGRESGLVGLIDDTVDAFGEIERVGRVKGVWFNRFHLEKQISSALMEASAWNSVNEIVDFFSN